MAELHLGRDTHATMQHWPTITASMPVAPQLCLGPRPKKSPNNKRYRNQRYRGQLIGDCVGENTTAMVETLLRMPANRTADSEPLTGTSLSPLMTYWLARKWAADHGMRLGGEGAIVSHAIQAIHKDGVVRIEKWAPTDAAYHSYSDRQTPSQDVMSEADQHPVREFALLDSWEAILGALAVGFTVSIGVPIPSGIQQCAADGKFDWHGGILGGHCMELMDYDEDEDKAWIGNSWANAGWGAHSDDPVWQGACRGRTNQGYCSLSDLARVFSPRAMSSGESEACVANNCVGWSPRVRSFTEVL